MRVVLGGGVLLVKSLPPKTRGPNIRRNRWEWQVFSGSTTGCRVRVLVFFIGQISGAKRPWG